MQTLISHTVSGVDSVGVLPARRQAQRNVQEQKRQARVPESKWVPHARYRISLLEKAYPEESFAPEFLTVVYKGRYGNANVYRYNDGRNDIILKDFSKSPWWFRMSMGRRFVIKECRSMRMLSGIKGIVPDVREPCPYAFCYRCIPGESLGALDKSGRKLPVEFFVRWESLVAEMGDRGLAHLDLRNMGNTLVGEDGNPYVIDFQSAVRLEYYPHFIRRVLRAADRSAVYKGWKRYCEEPLMGERAEWYEHFLKSRNVWTNIKKPLRWFNAKFWTLLGRKKK